MIAADTSSLVAFLRGEAGSDVEQISTAAGSGQLAISPVVIAQVLSGSDSSDVESILARIPILDPGEGYWQRCGRNRNLLKKKGLKAKVADALIAQSCIDHDVALITRDGDFRHFAKHCGLKLA
jgi:predicted nucleic acid-binding protein